MEKDNACAGLSMGSQNAQVKACDKAAPRPGRAVVDIFLHNVDWEVNEKRRPMYLTQIFEVDPAWLGEDWDASHGEEVDEDMCLAYLHRRRTIKLLQDVRDA
jgi:hypothetical protein